MLTNEDKDWFRTEFKSELISELKSEIIAETKQLIEALETRLLTEFHRWAQPYGVGARGTSTAVNLFDERLGMIEERVSALERGKN